MTARINTIYIKTYQPFIKWVGGKRGLLSKLLKKFINELYQKYNINKIEANRFINSKANGRGKISEVLIRNHSDF